TPRGRSTLPDALPISSSAVASATVRAAVPSAASRTVGVCASGASAVGVCAVRVVWVVSVIAAVSFRIVEDGRGELDVDEGAGQWGLDDLAFPIAAVLNERETEGPVAAG